MYMQAVIIYKPLGFSDSVKETIFPYSYKNLPSFIRRVEHEAMDAFFCRPEELQIGSTT